MDVDATTRIEKLWTDVAQGAGRLPRSIAIVSPEGVQLRTQSELILFLGLSYESTQSRQSSAMAAILQFEPADAFVFRQGSPVHETLRLTNVSDKSVSYRVKTT